MFKLLNFPRVIKTERLVLKVILPTKKNAEILFNIIEQNRDYLEAWQGYFGALRSVDSVIEKLQQRYNQITSNYGVLFGIYEDDN